ncbi:MAG: leucine-rich repeat domain-containing protein [Eubacterium sp.]
MKRNRFSALVLSFAVFITSVVFSFTAFGDDVNWYFDEAESTLHITGTGDMTNYSDAVSLPWYSIILKVENVIIDDGVTSVGDYAFSGASNLNNVSIPDSVTSVGQFSFSSCSSLNRLFLGENVISIGDESFAFDGVTQKQDFVLETTAGSYPLYFAVKNSIPFNCPSVKCSEYDVAINPAGMKAYYPYTAKVSGTFKFYSTGNHDTIGYLYDSSFNQLKYNDDAGSFDTNFSITADLTKGETYYIGASILNSRLTGNFKLIIEPVTYTVSGTINAMLDPSGAPSDIILTSATINGNETAGSFAWAVNDTNKTVTIICDNAQLEYTFSPDDGDEIAISLMMCDVNNDGWVNAKDYAIMSKSASPYIDLYGNFINYNY